MVVSKELGRMKKEVVMAELRYCQACAWKN
jgi:hypothetical protein